MRNGAGDEASAYDDAVEPVGLDDVRDFLKPAGAFTYAGRRNIARRRFRIHGHDLVTYETLQTVIDRRPTYVTLYLDASGRIAYLELTN